MKQEYSNEVVEAIDTINEEEVNEAKETGSR
jgi:hypothetical protein